MTLESDAPLGHVDEGEPIYVVVGADGQHLSHHRTPEGAEAARIGYSAERIDQTTLYQ